MCKYLTGRALVHLLQSLGSAQACALLGYSVPTLILIRIPTPAVEPQCQQKNGELKEVEVQLRDQPVQAQA